MPWMAELKFTLPVKLLPNFYYSAKN